MKRYANRMLMLTLLSGSYTSYALEFSPGDYEMLPANSNLLLSYWQYSHSDVYYNQHQQLNADYRLRSNALLLRYIHAYRPQEKLSIEPQLILPFAQATALGDASPLGASSGLGDSIFGVPIKYSLGDSAADVVAFAPFIYLPTGTYQQDRALNIGENRWRFLLQGVWIHHFSDAWSFETGADVSWVSKNDDYGAHSARLQQKPKYEYQAYLRYNLSPSTHLGIGTGWIKGAESRIDGVHQNDALDSRYLRVSAAHFINPSIQLQVSAGRDLSVAHGFKQDRNISLRLGVLF